MIKRILLYVDERPESQAAAAFALDLARACDARVFAVSVLPPGTNATAAKSGTCRPKVHYRPRRPQVPENQQEEEAWCRLYEIEDDCFEQDIKVSLLLEFGSRDDRLLSLVASYQLDMLIVGTQSTQGWEDLLRRSPIPVTLVRELPVAKSE